MATSLGEGKNEFKPVKLHLQSELVSHPGCVEGLSKHIRWKTF